MAQRLATGLAGVACVRPWDRGVFGIGQGTLEALSAQAESSDYAVLVATADDMLELRGERLHAPRDNVIFELGLFMGVIGCNRTFLIACGPSKELRIPTDLRGITMGMVEDYGPDRPSGDWEAGAEEVVRALVTRIEELGRRPECMAAGLQGEYNYIVTGSDSKRSYKHGGRCEIRRDASGFQIYGVRRWEELEDRRIKVERTWKSRWMRVTPMSLTFEYDITLDSRGARGLCNFPLSRDMRIQTGEFFYLAPAKVHGSIKLRRAAVRRRKDGDGEVRAAGGAAGL